MFYIIDNSAPRNNVVLNTITVPPYVDYTDGQTVSSYLSEKANEGVSASVLSPQQMEKQVDAYRQSIIGDWEEITEERYWHLLECVPPARSLGSDFAVGECYTMDLHHFCVKYGKRFYMALFPIARPFNSIRMSLVDAMSNNTIQTLS